MRRTFSLGLVSLAMVAGVHMSAFVEGKEAKRPNILFIYADDQSYKTLGCYGAAPPWVKTPNIDSLASQGVRFERSYLGAWCMPSRASILTGRLQHAVMSMTMEGKYPGSAYDPKQCPFVPAQFRAAGYQTAQIGKWHTGTDTGYGRDWDYQIVWNRPKHPENAGNYYHDQILTFHGEDRQVGGYSTDNYTDWAVEYLQGKHRDPNKPFYLWLCYGAIHGPTTPAKRYRGTLAGHQAKVPDDILGPWPEKPAYLEVTKAWMLGPNGVPVKGKKARAANNFDSLKPGQPYQAWIEQVNECMAAVDEGVGRVLAALEASGELENTLVVYSADQGYALGEHGLNQKVAPYDAAISSPMIIRWPGKTPAGAVCKHAVNSPDLVDLFCRAAGVTIPWKTHGRDIRKLVSDPATTDWHEPMLMTHTAQSYGAETDTIPTDRRLTAASNVPWYALLRDGKYKYVRTMVAGEMEELYDLEADPEELKNLALRSEHADRLSDLRRKTIDELRRTDAKFVDRLPEVRGER